MATVALFPSVLGVRRGVTAAAEALTDLGHDVRVVDVFEGRTFDAYEPAMAFAEGVDPEVWWARAAEATEDLPPGFSTAGFSFGAGLAEYVATIRPVCGVVLLAGAVDPRWLPSPWPQGVSAELHTTVGDPFREQVDYDALAESVRAAGGRFEQFEYPGDGHLFTDPSLPDEYDSVATGLVWDRVGDFLARCGG